jgi:hypothetical protein
MSSSNLNTSKHDRSISPGYRVVAWESPSTPGRIENYRPEVDRQGEGNNKTGEFFPVEYHCKKGVQSVYSFKRYYCFNAKRV